MSLGSTIADPIVHAVDIMEIDMNEMTDEGITTDPDHRDMRHSLRSGAHLDERGKRKRRRLRSLAKHLHPLREARHRRLGQSQLLLNDHKG